MPATALLGTERPVTSVDVYVLVVGELPVAEEAPLQERARRGGLRRRHRHGSTRRRRGPAVLGGGGAGGV